MKPDIAEILEKALRLLPEARAPIAGWLLDSLEETQDADIESAWEDEVLFRLKEIDEGSVKLGPLGGSWAAHCGQIMARRGVRL